MPCLLIAPPVAMLTPEQDTRHRARRIVIAGAGDEYAPEAWLRETWNGSAYELSVLPDVDHYFLGSGAQRLADALAKLVL